MTAQKNVLLCNLCPGSLINTVMKSFSFFASANTGIGFVNNFEFINNVKKKGFAFVLKGGPGTGKSSLMKKIGSHFSDQGAEVEYFYCSSDPSSIDGVRLPQHNICILDGTAPHSTEVNLPAIDGAIVNLGEFIGSGVEKNARIIRTQVAAKKKCYQECYAFLEAARAVMLADRIHQSKSDDAQLADIHTSKLWEELALPPQPGQGYERKLFLSTLCARGLDSFQQSQAFENILLLEQSDTICTQVLRNLKQKLLDNGQDVTVFLNMVCPDIIDCLYLPEQRLLIAPAPAKQKANHKIITALLKRAAKCLMKARLHHKRVEKCYINHTDFSGIDQITQDLIREISARMG